MAEELCLPWRKWRAGLTSLEGFGIPRCYKPRVFGEVKCTELHHFADASQEHGYGTASYLLFAIFKSHVRPLKSAVTVPKFELAAATLAVTINRVVMKELEGQMKIDTVTYWTDSMIVLKYIANDIRRFVTFVANRIDVIGEESEPSQW